MSTEVLPWRGITFLLVSYLLIVTTSLTSPSAALKRLPSVEEFNFRTIIEEDRVYVDKTEFLSLMLQEDGRKFFFLSRPRRFGKSMYVDMMRNFFEGEKKLFEGTYIYENRSELEWPKYPVIKIDFTDGISSRSVEKFEEDLTGILKNIAESNNIHIINDEMSPERALKTLIEKLKNNTGLNVVILIDEYDAAYSANYGKPQAPAILQAIQSFFRTIKAQRSNIHLMYFTGSSRMAISEFFTSTTSLDLSMEPKYSTILGFTEDELKKYLHGHVELVAGIQNEDVKVIYEEMKKWHDGFDFTGSGQHIYNPCSVISYLTKLGREKIFFTESGGLSTILMKKFLAFPKYVYNYIARYATGNVNPEGKEQLVVPKSILSGQVDIADETYKSLLAILYQGGYFSIDKQHNMNGYAEPHYILRFSNLEVEVDYIKRLSTILFKTKKRELQQRIEDMREALESGNYWTTFISHLESIFAKTPYFLYMHKKMNEAMFQFQMYVTMFEAGYDPDMEVMTSSGRADLAIVTPSKVFIVEPKLIENEENPLDQCRKKYLKRFMNYQQEVICIGLKFSQQAEIPEWGVAHFSKTGQLLEEYGMIRLTNNSDQH